MKEYLKLNNEVLNTYTQTGSIDREKDELATKKYFLDEINMKTVFFHNLKEKLDHLTEERYYEKEFLNLYDYEFIKEIFDIAYDYKFRFPSFMSAFKTYNNYTLKTRDDKNILERYEDRIAITSLYLAQGDKELAKKSVKYIMECLTPATPTILNSGKQARGELVSCFKLLIDDTMNSISHNIGNSLQLSKLGGGVGLSLIDLRCAGDPIKGIENRASGVMPVAKLLENSFSYANQLGSRAGSGVIWLHIMHGDILDFLSAKKPNADEKIRLATLSTGVVIPDIFFKLLEEDKDVYLFSPYDIKNKYGKRMSELDMSDIYYELLNDPNVRKLKKINARKLYTEVKKTQIESGYPFEMFDGNVQRGNPLNKIGKIKISNLCVTGDTLLLTDKGYKTAKDLYDSQENLNVIIDNRTIDFNNDNKGTEVVSAIPMKKTAKGAEIFKINTKQGYDIKATEWHKFYVKENDVIKKVQLNELKEGDKLLVQSGEGSFGEIYEPELAYLMGIIAGDGTFTDKQVKIYLYDNKKHLSDLVEKMVHSVINKHKVDRPYKHNTSFNPTFNKANSERQDLLHMSSTVLYDILHKFGMTKDTKTRVPKFIYEADKETQCAYLSGLYQMDGTVNANFKSKALTIELTSIDKEGLQDIQKLLLNMGIYSSLYTNANRKTNVLPDSNGNPKEYSVKVSHKLSVQDRASREKFVELITLKEYDMKKFNMLTETLQKKSRKPKHDFTTEISSIEFEGFEDVYDTTQKDYSSLIFNGIVTGNCTEILQLQEMSEINDYDEVDVIGQDVSCNLASNDIHKSTKVNDFADLIDTSVRILTNVSDMTSINNVPSVAKGNEEMHSIGLGVMNMHGHLIMSDIDYGSEESLNFADVYFSATNYHSLRASCDIAKDKGVTFKGFEESDYATGKYFDYYLNNPIEIKYEKVKNALGNVKPITIEEWLELKEDVMEYGLYHSFRLAIAPTGNISYVRSSTPSLSPITERVEVRDYGDSRTIYPAPFLNDENKDKYLEAYEMDMFKMVDLYAVTQRHIDQGISMTLYITDDWDTERLTRLYYYAYKKGIKTVYYVRQRMKTLDECVSCSI